MSRSRNTRTQSEKTEESREGTMNSEIRVTRDNEQTTWSKEDTVVGLPLSQLLSSDENAVVTQITCSMELNRKFDYGNGASCMCSVKLYTTQTAPKMSEAFRYARMICEEETRNGLRDALSAYKQVDLE
jgi:hypothetical protein